MGIIFKQVKRKNVILPTFKKLSVGDCFESEGGDLYIKTDGDVEGVCLMSGRRFYFCEDDPVNRIIIEATVKDK